MTKETSMGNRIIEGNIIDIFKWVVSIFLGLFIFTGSVYTRTYFGIFGAYEFLDLKSGIEIIFDSINVFMRMNFVVPLILEIIVFYILAVRFHKFRTALTFAFVIASFATAGLVGQAEARKDARRLLTGESGRVAWCKMKDSFYSGDENLRRQVEETTSEGNFFLLLHNGNNIFITEVDKGSKNVVQGNTIIIKMEDISYCRFSGANI